MQYTEGGNPSQGHTNMCVTQNPREGHLIRMQNIELKALNLERVRLNRDNKKAGKSFQGRNIKGFHLITFKS